MQFNTKLRLENLTYVEWDTFQIRVYLFLAKLAGNFIRRKKKRATYILENAHEILVLCSVEIAKIFSHTISQKFRENNGLTKEITK